MSTQQTIDVEYRGGMSVAALIEGRAIVTDQPVKDGGQDAAPSPFDLFLAALATCAGLYAQRFCESRSLSTEGLGLRVTCTYADKGFHVEAMDFALTLPEGFPEKYRDALLRAVDLCTVKKHIVTPPRFSVRIAE